MASLTGQEIKNTYQGLLKTTDNGPITTGLKVITDGLGNDTPLALSSSQVQIGGGWTLSGNNIFNFTSSNIQYLGNFFLWQNAFGQTSIALSGSTGNINLQKDSARLDMSGNNQAIWFNGTQGSITFNGSSSSINFSGNNGSLNFTNSNSAINFSATTATINISSGTVNTRNLTLTNTGVLTIANSNHTISLVNGSGASGQVLAKRAAGGYEWITPTSWVYSTITATQTPPNFNAPTFSVKKLGTQVFQEGIMECTTNTTITNSGNYDTFGNTSGLWVFDPFGYPMDFSNMTQIMDFNYYGVVNFVNPTQSIGRWSVQSATGGGSGLATFNQKGSGTILVGYIIWRYFSSSGTFPAMLLVADTSAAVSVAVGDKVAMQFNYRTTTA